MGRVELIEKVENEQTLSGDKRINTWVLSIPGREKNPLKSPGRKGSRLAGETVRCQVWLKRVSRER